MFLLKIYRKYIIPAIGKYLANILAKTQPRWEKKGDIYCCHSYSFRLSFPKVIIVYCACYSLPDAHTAGGCNSYSRCMFCDLSPTGQYSYPYWIFHHTSGDKTHPAPMWVKSKQTIYGSIFDRTAGLVMGGEGGGGIILCTEQQLPGFPPTHNYTEARFQKIYT